MSTLPVTRRTKLGRLPERGSHELARIRAILDEGMICHVGFVADGSPVVIPTGYALFEDRLIVHGSAASRMLRAMAPGVDVCVTVTLLDGLVLARSAFHHSMNYRSVMIYGHASILEGEEKRRGLDALVEHIIPGRSASVRPPTDRELRQTLVLALALDEASAKIRTGPPVDDEEDYASDAWAGVIPLRTTALDAIPDPRLSEGIECPSHVTGFSARLDPRDFE